MSHLRQQGHDLDSWLSSSQRAELLAFSGLVRGSLDVATEFSMWSESQGFREHSKAAFSAGLAFPLNHIMPWTYRRDARRRLGRRDPDEVYERACEALGALGDRLRTSGGHFFFGGQPSSLDALLVGHLAFYRFSPAAAPVLHEKVTSDIALSTFVDHVLSTYLPVMPTANPRAPPAQSSNGGAGADKADDDGTARASHWSEAARGHKTQSPPQQPTGHELELRRRAWYWLGAVGAAMLCYVVLCGRYPALNQVLEALGEEPDEGDEGDDDDVDVED